MTQILKYTDENDKSLGIAGMAISLLAGDAEDYLAGVSLEADGEPLTLSESFFFSGNPRFSAKIAWNEMLRQYRVTTGMLLANVLCRAFGAGHSPSGEAMSAVHEVIINQGHETCELDDDEISTIYNRHYSYYNRLFTHPTVMLVARDFAATLQRQRHMSAGEVFEHLRRLNSL